MDTLFMLSVLFMIAAGGIQVLILDAEWLDRLHDRHPKIAELIIFGPIVVGVVAVYITGNLL